MGLPFWGFLSEPKSASFFQERNEGAVDVGGHNAIHGADELAADEDDGEGGGAAEEAGEGPLDLLATWVVVELVDRRIDAHPAEEPLDGVAHAARAEAEDHHRALRRQLLHTLQRVRRNGGVAGMCRRHVRAPGLGLVMHRNVTGIVRNTEEEERKKKREKKEVRE